MFFILFLLLIIASVPLLKTPTPESLERKRRLEKGENRKKRTHKEINLFSVDIFLFFDDFGLN